MAVSKKLKKAAQYDKIKNQILELSRYRNLSSHTPFSLYTAPESVIKRAKDTKQDLLNKALKQDIDLKKWTLLILFIFLAFETFVIFTYAFFQATFKYSFKLEEWSFKLLVTATILQITFMLQVAVKHLFPESKK